MAMYKITVSGQCTFVLCKTIRDVLRFLGLAHWHISPDEMESLLALDAMEITETLKLMRGSDSLLIETTTLDEIKDMLA